MIIVVWSTCLSIIFAGDHRSSDHPTVSGLYRDRGVMLDDHRRKLKYLRHKRARERRRRGVMCATIEVDADVIDFLIKAGWVKENACDAKSVGVGVTQGLKLSAAASPAPSNLRRYDRSSLS
jgi:hypothetical protein